jgi:multidrug transporter EmrE-like cation transporter
MNLTTIFAVLALVVGISVGQVLFKVASLDMREPLTLSNITAMLFNPYFIAAIIIYAVTTLLWGWVLQHADLSKAYPFVALSFVLVPAAGIIFFGERATVGLGVGIALILAGIWIIVRYA